MIRAHTDYIVVHCSATPRAADIGAKEIDGWHKARGWQGIGYHYVIRRNGKKEFGRPQAIVGAHCLGHNMTSVAVCLVGGVDEHGKLENNFTVEQWRTLTPLLRQLCAQYPTAEVVGHRDLSPDVDGDGVVEPHEWIKGCPSFDVRSWWATINRQGEANG